MRDIPVSYGKIASVHLRLGNFDHALIEFRKGRDVIAALVAIAPSNARWAQDLAWFDSEIAKLEEAAQAASRK